jgi:hypothetical protein
MCFGVRKGHGTHREQFGNFKQAGTPTIPRCTRLDSSFCTALAAEIIRWQIRAMSSEAIEQKLTELTARVARLEKNIPPVAKPTWREIIGTSQGDEIDRAADRIGEEWRRSEGGH